MNKLAVVTGASRGIGKAILDRFLQAGFDAILCARNTKTLKEAAGAYRVAYPGRVVLDFSADLSQVSGCKELSAFANGLGRPIDVLVNNAGHFVPGRLADEPAGTLEGMIESNLYSAYHLTRGLLEGMRARKHGHIFNICSVASVKAYPNGGSYAIAKAALLGFSRTLREELKPDGIRVTSVIPGATYTQSWSASELPEERFMKPEDVAEVVFNAYSLSGRSVVEEVIIRPMLGDI